MSEEVFIDRLECVGIITRPGERKGKVPLWLSTNEIICPNCGRAEYANAEPGKVKMCGLCLANEAIKAERQKELTGPPLAARPRPFRLPTKELKKCERCRESFRGRSNSQRFCEPCQKGSKNDRNRLWMGENRNEPASMSLVDE